MALPRIGDTLDGKYRIDAIIGRGNIGVVARAHHLLRDADVALKFLRADEADGDDPRARKEMVDRFRLEAIASSRLDTNHVVQIHDVGETTDGTAYLVMEHLVGEDLESVLLREKRLSTARSLHIVLQVARALSVAHAAGVVHRDLKPGNIFLTECDGEADFVKLLDFGISKVSQGGANDETLRLTSDDVGMGTPLYMAPEQARDARSVTAASDLYSLAAVLYECIAGKTPLDATSTIELFYKLVHEIPRRLDLDFEVPRGLADAVEMGLAKAPEDRPASIEAFAALLAPYADERAGRALLSLRLTPRGSLSVPPLRETSASRRSLAGTHFAHDVSRRDEDELDAVRPKPARFGLALAFAIATLGCFTAGTYLTHRVSAAHGAPAAAEAAVTAPPAAAVTAPPAVEPAAVVPEAAPPAASSAAGAPTPTPVQTAAAKASRVVGHGRTLKVNDKPTDTPAPAHTVNLADNPTTADVPDSPYADLNPDPVPAKAPATPKTKAKGTNALPALPSTEPKE